MMPDQDHMNMMVFKFIAKSPILTGKALFKLIKAIYKTHRFINEHFTEKSSDKAFIKNHDDAMLASNEGKDPNSKDFMPSLGNDGTITFMPFVADDPMTKQQKVVIPADKYMRTFKRIARKYGVDYSLTAQTKTEDGRKLTKGELREGKREGVQYTLHLRSQQTGKIPLFFENYLSACEKLEEKESSRDRKESVRGKLDNFRKRPVAERKEQLKDHAHESR